MKSCVDSSLPVILLRIYFIIDRKTYNLNLSVFYLSLSSTHVHIHMHSHTYTHIHTYILTYTQHTTHYTQHISHTHTYTFVFFDILSSISLFFPLTSFIIDTRSFLIPNFSSLNSRDHVICYHSRCRHMG